MLDFDLETLARHEAGLVERTAGDLERGEERRVGAAASELPLAISPRLVSGDVSLRLSGTCVKIGVGRIDW